MRNCHAYVLLEWLIKLCLLKKNIFLKNSQLTQVVTNLFGVGFNYYLDIFTQDASILNSPAKLLGAVRHQIYKEKEIEFANLPPTTV